MRLLLLAIAIFGLAACESTEQWGEWEQIAADQSLIAVAQPADVTLPEIERWRRDKRYPREVQESWSWPGGGSLTRLAPGYQFYFQADDPDILLDDYKSWDEIREAGIEVDKSQVRRRDNAIGNYFYATAHSSDGRVLCFVSSQGLQPRSAPETQSTPGAAGGIWSIRYCVDRAVSEDAVVHDMTAILDNISLR